MARLKQAMAFRDPETLEAVVFTPQDELPDWASDLVVADDLAEADAKPATGSSRRPAKQTD